jgi:DNA processing protein
MKPDRSRANKSGQIHLLTTLEDISPSELIAALFELEMTGLVKQLPGKNFVKVW